MMRSRSCRLLPLNTMELKSVFKGKHENCTEKIILKAELSMKMTQVATVNAMYLHQSVIP